MNSKQNLVVFLPATDSEHKIIQILHRKGQNKIWTELSSLGQEPTFNSWVPICSKQVYLGRNSHISFEIIREAFIKMHGL